MSTGEQERLLDPERRVALQRRTLGVLIPGQVVGATALGSAITIGPLVVEDIVGPGTPFVGVTTAAMTLGSGVMAQLLSRVMRRRGRRAGMQLGYGLAALGSLLAFAGVETSMLAVFLPGLVFYGAGSATNLLARYAATDLAAPGERSTAMGTILFAMTFGAIFGPSLVAPAEWVGEAWFGLEKYSGPWLFSAVLFAVALLNVVVRLRPDPLLVLLANDRTVDLDRPVRLIVSLAAIRSSPAARLGLIAMVLTQLVMIGLMAMAPMVMKHAGHEVLGPFVLSVHLVGMYAISPLVGWYADRVGQRAVLQLGAWIMIVASASAFFAGDSVPIMFVSMLLLGVGSTMGLITGSNLLSDGVSTEVRVPVQGTADLFTAISGGMAGVLAGFALTWFGFGLLGIGAALLCVPILLGLRWERDVLTVS